MGKPTPLELALALLRETKEVGRGPITRTVYHKLFYLVDILHAEENEGQPATGFEWKFVHFGPFSVQVAEAITQAEADSHVETRAENKASNDDQFFTYQLRDYGVVKNLCELGFSGRVQREIQQAIRAKCSNINELLHYVYFSTRPMESATPGATLSFHECRKFNVADYKHIAMKRLSSSSISNAQQLIKAALAKRKAVTYKEPGKFDAIYFQQIGDYDDQHFEPGASGTAELNF